MGSGTAIGMAGATGAAIGARGTTAGPNGNSGSMLPEKIVRVEVS